MTTNLRQQLLSLLVLASGLLLHSLGCASSAPSGPVALPLLASESSAGPTAVSSASAIRMASVSANVLRTHREMGPILRYLSDKLGRRFELVYCRSYREMLETVEERRCEFAWLSAQTYLTLSKATGCQPVVQLARDGRASYRGLLVSAAGKSLDSPESLKGKRLALVSKNSTSGYAYPMAFFRSKGIEPATWFASVSYTGSHEGAAMAVLRGLADCACIEEPVLERLRTKVDVSGLAIIAVTGEIPNGPIVALKGVPREQALAVGSALLGLYADPAAQALVEGLRKDSDFTGFLPATDATYDEVRRVQTQAGL